LRATGHSQVLVSPGYPNSYPGGLECVYVINAPSGKLITLKVEDFGLTSPRDSLLIRDGDTPSSPKLALLTGSASENPKFITSTGSQLYLYMTTSGNGGVPGFQIKYYQGKLILHSLMKSFFLNTRESFNKNVPKLVRLDEVFISHTQ
jgi:hypothetical protein